MNVKGLMSVLAKLPPEWPVVVNGHRTDRNEEQDFAPACFRVAPSDESPTPAVHLYRAKRIPKC
jgi:hypothetical protein